ncbi:3,4-dihydroxy-2-butanone-4-phosphate synthase [Cohnella lubricantis]|uniref:3,4-dihydroxy-2-butanone 4-phosphate synthase n=1 Tax=Cohnella lubricantis TaxID=2163172 RepID=A0A841TBQ3_9BACL|nr:3,4-dihydroxy-2-butanone-4-phosphate synthase [Cohnella lubricantis]MBB6677459.1 3,4-dihydroxy-2-butanone-4-phosphate synthase [Cohnella lubricantis]MBP2116655.1 3,4-dihydroxy-2-butanone 4-phosphate synthase [Cohnella lubricantis]
MPSDITLNLLNGMEHFKKGRPVIIIDDFTRENEGDIVIAAEFASPEIINFMAKNGRGLICVAIDEQLARRFDLDLMVRDNSESHRTAFTVSIDAHPKHGITTGISAYERSKTIEVLLDPTSRKEDMCRPGHLFPIIAKPNGVMDRRGHTEASTDLCKMCGLRPAAVIVEIMKSDGTMARLPDLRKLAKRWDMPLLSIEEIHAARSQRGTEMSGKSDLQLASAGGSL